AAAARAAAAGRSDGSARPRAAGADAGTREALLLSLLRLDVEQAAEPQVKAPCSVAQGGEPDAGAVNLADAGHRHLADALAEDAIEADHLDRRLLASGAVFHRPEGAQHAEGDRSVDVGRPGENEDAAIADEGDRGGDRRQPEGVGCGEVCTQ